MSSENSITRLIGQLKEGDRAAAKPLWDAYFRRLVGLARDRLRHTPRQAVDEEDVALSAFDSFCRRAERGEFPRLSDRGDLWQLLFVLTVRKAISLARRQGRVMRAGRVATLADLSDLDLDATLGPEPSPALAAQVTDECRRLLNILEDESLRAVALWKMEGWSNREIADRIGCVEKTVERKLRRIRQLWAGEAGA